MKLIKFNPKISELNFSLYFSVHEGEKNSLPFTLGWLKKKTWDTSYIINFLFLYYFVGVPHGGSGLYARVWYRPLQCRSLLLKQDYSRGCVSCYSNINPSFHQLNIQAFIKTEKPTRTFLVRLCCIQWTKF